MSNLPTAGLRHEASRFVVITFLLTLAAAPGVAAQTTTTLGAIDGVVTDETGGALPGVTLTLTSPALQVPQMTAISDSQGRYRFSDLRVGTYRVVAELQGFQSLIRENLELSVGFVARIDITMKVGSLAETVTVSGASPVVDVTTTRGGQTINTLVANQYIPLVGHESDVVRLTPGLSGGLGARSGNPTQVGLQGNMSLSAYGQSGVTAMVEDFEMHSNNQPPNLSRCAISRSGDQLRLQFRWKHRPRQRRPVSHGKRHPIEQHRQHAPGSGFQQRRKSSELLRHACEHRRAHQTGQMVVFSVGSQAEKRAHDWWLRRGPGS